MSCCMRRSSQMSHCVVFLFESQLDVLILGLEIIERGVKILVEF